jgi:hypothetical protein
VELAHLFCSCLFILGGTDECLRTLNMMIPSVFFLMNARVLPRKRGWRSYGVQLCSPSIALRRKLVQLLFLESRNSLLYITSQHHRNGNKILSLIHTSYSIS